MVISPPPSSTLSLFLLLFLISSTLTTAVSTADATTTSTCTDVHHQNTSTSKCLYVQTHTGCQSKGYINYIQIFYCNFSSFPQLGFILLLLWLVILFYILSDTASNYFCPSLENLSKILNLSPAIAGTTLLPLGNGCTDVFASIVSFNSSGDGGDIGLNSILGGSIFITTVVVGILSLLLVSRRTFVIVDKLNFIRDVVFLLFTLTNLLVIIIIGEINFWVSLLFASTYVIYICMVSFMHFISMKKQRLRVLDEEDENEEDKTVPLLGCVDEEKVVHSAEQVVPHKETINTTTGWFLYSIRFPVYLPRRLTIPVVTRDKWSKPFAVISVFLAPMMLAAIWCTQGNLGSKASWVVYLVAGAIGTALGTCTYVLTSSTLPPQKCLFIWHASGFLMSVTWTYITAEELVSLLDSLGTIIGMNPSILGLTILAWGNSIGDLTANIAIAMHGGPDGAQIAVSGCYAGPVFNILIGLGFSLVFASWSNYPAPFEIPVDPYLCETIGFLMGGLLWALVILPKREMQLDRLLGAGLLAIYSCFLFLKLARALGLVNDLSSNMSSTIL